MHQHDLKKECLPQGFASKGGIWTLCRRPFQACKDQTSCRGIHFTCIQAETITKKEPKNYSYKQGATLSEKSQLALAALEDYIRKS